MKNPKVWSITDGGAGMMSQSDGLAAALNKNFIRKNCQIKPWLRFLPIAIQLKLFPRILQNNEIFCSPWPDIAIGAGRDSITSLRWVKKCNPKTFVIYVQNPGIYQARFFDLVISTDHSYVKTKNAINTEFALHKITQTSLKEAGKSFDHLFKNKPKPWKSIIIGGTAPHYKFGQKETAKLLEDIHKIIETKGSVFITTSRRTGSENIDTMEQSFKSFGDKVYLYRSDQKNAVNPYMGILANSDQLYLTEDSVSMISEACYTGKPVILLPLDNFRRSSIKKFTKHLINKRRVHYFGDENIITNESLQNDREMDKVVAQVKFIINEYLTSGVLSQ